MILIGQFDSPFTRRVGITLRLYGLAFEHRPWSVFGDAERLSGSNPLIRVPTLVLDNGDVLVETAAIIDYLDSMVASAVRLTPQAQPERYRVQHVVALASGISDIAVRLFYEQRLHDTPAADYVRRLQRQICQTLITLEEARSHGKGETWLGGSMSQADIAVVCTLRHLREAHPHVFLVGQYPSLEKHCAVYETMTVFKDISQPFVAPA